MHYYCVTLPFCRTAECETMEVNHNINSIWIIADEQLFEEQKEGLGIILPHNLYKLEYTNWFKWPHEYEVSIGNNLPGQLAVVRYLGTSFDKEQILLDLL